MSKELIIHDGNYKDHLAPIIDGRQASTGLIERDYAKHPPGCYATVDAVDVPIIPRSEWSARIKEMEETKSRLSDIRNTGNFGKRIPSLNQNPYSFCWAHSATHATMMLRAIFNLPYVPLSAFAVACMIKNYRNEGGWGAEALDFISQRGVPDQKFWAQQSMSRSNDNPATWANAALHRVTAGWIDIKAPVYNRTMPFDQVFSLLLTRTPGIGDYYWWRHSVNLLDPVEVERNSFGIRIWNSWGDEWSDYGTAVLQGDKAIPNGATAPRLITASAA
ncbi:hypothetical protein KIH39_00115 [Telmatocola sphagniphila]|uniref:Uncharacterized protein n=1 Tax=Telmatocola sphagniphila TaxID=1123043 RepID=A0A8E6ETF1_9BACT|nr:hypothetical protein [Telmatocola sphagniphila]QVL32359.1 hypothetical protein KIH39_00115 [Telmatocola sphagniphila]